MKRLLIATSVLLLVVAGSCRASSCEAEPTAFPSTPLVATPSVTVTSEVPPLEAPPAEVPLPITVVPGEPPDAALEPVTGEVPAEILEAILAEVAEQTGAQPEQVEFVRAEQAIWNDGSLGCPQPGVVYTQAPVTGYWVVLQFNGETFDFRVNERGIFTRCDGPTLPGREAPAG